MSDETDKKEETTTPKTEEEPKKKEEVEHEESTATFEPVVSTQNSGEAMGEKKTKKTCVRVTLWAFVCLWPSINGSIRGIYRDMDVIFAYLNS